MKQYLDQQQSAKLIELGLPEPKLLYFGNNTIGHYAYTIGELIEMLPEPASQRLRYVATKGAWIVDIDVLGKQGRCHRGVYYRELIDALYDMVIKLKEEGVI